jgi:transcriptional regulator GlxA family with amidase domain
MPDAGGLESVRNFSACEFTEIKPDVRFAFILSPEFTLLPFAGFIDSVRHCADERDLSRQVYCHWTCIGPTLEPVKSSCGIEIAPWKTFDDPQNYDYVIVVGGRLAAFDQHRPETFEFLREASEVGIPLVGLCTGSFALAEAGLMDEIRCAVHAVHKDELLERYPLVIPIINEMYVSENNRITCPGGTAAIDLAIDILTQHCGINRGNKALFELVIDKHRDARHIGKLPFRELQTCGDWRVEEAIGLMNQSMSEPISSEKLAKCLSISRRQLDRVFQTHVGKTPQELYRDMRLEHARWRLLNSSRTITQIAYECGFSDCAHFVRWFKRKNGLSPKHYRGSRRRDFWSSPHESETPSAH